MPTGSPPSIHIFLLGRFEITRGERVLRVSDWTRRKAAALLQRLALERRLTKDQAIDFLWPEADPISGANNLYRTLHALRQTVDTALGARAADATFAFEDGTLNLGGSTWVDVHEFERLAAPSPADPSEQRLASLEQALALYQGDLLPDDLYAEWTQTPRDALRRLYREASLALVTHHRAQRDYVHAIARLTRLVTHDPADETAHRELMRVYALAGRRHEALRQYQTCLDALARELDVPPEPETSALYSQILSGELAPAPATASRVWIPPTPLHVDPDAALFGRQVEFETLLARIQKAQSGQTILLAGDAGVGKTRLAFEILRACASAGITTLIGAAYEQEGQLPYQPFIEAFNRYLVEHQQATDRNPITHHERLGTTDPEQEQWALLNSVAAFLTGLCLPSSPQGSGSVPVVLLIDDLHAAEEASLRLFHYLARQTRGAPVTLFATYRADAAVPASPFATLLHTLYRERLSETLTLEPLTQEATTRVIEQVLDGKASPDLSSAVYEIAEGNPFYVQEIARALIKTNQVEERAGTWFLRGGFGSRPPLSIPADLEGLLRQHVARLGTQVEAVMTAAAIIGREFDYETLRGVTTLSDAAVLDALDAALAGHLLEETETGYRFRHALIRRALDDALNRARRAQLHSRTAISIEAVHARRPGGLALHVEALAYHYDLSDRRDRALDYLIQAGQKAADVFAFEVAVDYFERALALIDALGLADPARRLALLEPLGEWHKILADTPRAVACFEQAIALAPTHDWQSTRRDRVRLHRGAAVALITAGELDAAEAHLRVVLAEVDEREDAPEYARLLYNGAQIHWHRGEYREAFEMAQKSLGVAERINQPDAIARAFEMLALACHSLGEWQRGIQYEQQRATLVGSGLDVTDAFDVHL